MQKLDDTCAKCHPSFLTAEINKRHDDLRDRLMARLRKTSSRGEALELRRTLDEAHAARSKELLSVGKWRGVV